MVGAGVRNKQNDNSKREPIENQFISTREMPA